MMEEMSDVCCEWQLCLLSSTIWRHWSLWGFLMSHGKVLCWSVRWFPRWVQLLLWSRSRSRIFKGSSSSLFVQRVSLDGWKMSSDSTGMGSPFLKNFAGSHDNGYPSSMEEGDEGLAAPHAPLSTFSAARQSRGSHADDTETIQRAILDFIPPPNTMRYDKRRLTGVTSVIYNYGVKLVSSDASVLYPSRWYCMTSDDCRRKGRHFSCPDKNTSTVIKHLKDIHNIVNGRPQGVKERSSELDGNISLLWLSLLASQYVFDNITVCILVALMFVVVFSVLLEFDYNLPATSYRRIWNLE